MANIIIHQNKITSREDLLEVELGDASRDDGIEDADIDGFG